MDLNTPVLIAEKNSVYERGVMGNDGQDKDSSILLIPRQTNKVSGNFINPISHGGRPQRPPLQHFCDCSGTVIARTLKFFDFS